MDTLKVKVRNIIVKNSKATGGAGEQSRFKEKKIEINPMARDAMVNLIVAIIEAKEN